MLSRSSSSRAIRDALFLGCSHSFVSDCPFLHNLRPSLNQAPAAQSGPTQRCSASSASSNRWKARQARDPFGKEARVAGLKSRAAFKLLQINDRYKIFKPGNTVVDLGYAPGSWSQVCDAGIFSSDILTHNFRKVAANRTHPNGRVVGIDILPAQPPKGVSTLQGDFLSPAIQAELRAYISDPDRGRPRPRHTMVSRVDDAGTDSDESDVSSSAESERGYLEMERLNTQEPSAARTEESQDDLDSSQQEYEERGETEKDHRTPAERDRDAGRVVDVVLSDMCEPWDQTAGFGKKSVSDPYRRMMNTSGMPFRDHAGSMDLCMAALTFCFDTLKSEGHFVAKFYQGSEDKLLEQKICRLFHKVHRDKPSASRSESREGYFVALRRKEGPSREEVFAE